MFKSKFIACLAVLCSVGMLAGCNPSTESTSGDKTSTGATEETPSDFDASKKISVYTRPTTSGTRECFFENIGYKAGKDGGLVAGANEAAENGDMINSVKGDEYAIGYASLDSLKGSNTGVRGLKFEGVEATTKTAEDGSYRLQRHFNIVAKLSGNKVSDSSTTEQNTLLDSIVKAYWDFTFSKDGLSIAAQNGGIVPAATLSAAKAFNTSDYDVFTKDASALTLKIAGSTSVKKISAATENAFANLWGDSAKAVNFDVTAQTGSGTAIKGLQAGTAQVGYLSRELEDAESSYIKGLGEAGKTDSICIDAVVAIVNEKNTVVDNITKDQLARIYLDANYTDKDGNKPFADAFKDGKTAITTWAQLAA